MTPDLIARLRNCANGIGSFKSESGDFGLCDEAADALETLMEHAEAMAKVMARIGRAEPCHCARCTAMSEDARQSLASFRAAFPEVGE